MTDEESTGTGTTGTGTGTGTTAAETELADAMDSIQSIGEDWRSSERARASDDDENEGENDG